MKTTCKSGLRCQAILAVLIFLISSPILRLPAATITWTNTLGGNWNVASNWSPNAVPGATDTANITTAGSYSVALNANATVAALTLGAPSGTQTLTIGTPPSR
jgi:hypothetical protein